jgi:low affinity Fe/Cu permease
MDALQHPVERRQGKERGLFERGAQSASYVASSRAFFAFCLVLVLVWLAGYVVGAGPDFEVAMGIAMTAVTLLLVALLKNSELLAERAIQEKLDALATAMLEELRSERDKGAPMLDRAIKLENEI